MILKWHNTPTKKILPPATTENINAAIPVFPFAKPVLDMRGEPLGLVQVPKIYEEPQGHPVSIDN
jgi:hypothetical protein